MGSVYVTLVLPDTEPDFDVGVMAVRFPDDGLADAEFPVWFVPEKT